MNRISSIIGYIAIVAVIIYFTVSTIIERNIREALDDFEGALEEIEGLRYGDVQFGLLSGDVDIEQLEFDSIQDFTNIKVNSTTLSLDWKDRYRFLVSDEFSIWNIQELNLLFNEISMLEDGVTSWSIESAEFNLAGDVRNTFLEFMQDKLPRRPFQGVISVKEVDLKPPPEFSTSAQIEDLMFPLEDVNIETNYDPGLGMLISQIQLVKGESFRFNSLATVSFEQRPRRELLPMRAIFDFSLLSDMRNHRFDISESGGQIEMDKLSFGGKITLTRQEESFWLPTDAETRLQINRPVLFPSTPFVRKFGPYLQTFGFENGFAELDTLKALLQFDNGILSVEKCTLNADWIKAEVGFQTSFFDNQIYNAPIQNGNIHIFRMSDPIRAGVKFVERQTQTRLFNADGSLDLTLSGQLNAPKVTDLFN